MSKGGRGVGLQQRAGGYQLASNCLGGRLCQTAKLTLDRRIELIATDPWRQLRDNNPG
jgi:hypothetical protein